MSRFLLVLIGSVLLACATDKPLDDVKPSPPQPRRAVAPVVPPKKLPAAEPAREAPIPPAPEDCQALPAGITLPHYISASSVVVMSFLKSCRTSDGREGFKKGSSWTAMGFPCTAGRGRIDKKGSENVPSVVSFQLQNSCPMQPGRPEDVEALVRQKWNLPADSRLIAYYPLSVDYWEFVDYPEHNVGNRPEIVTPTSISNGWQKFSTKGEGLKLRLYGRENAWEPGHKLYEVEAQMLPEGRGSFRLQVESAKVLDQAAKAKVSERCEARRPKRECSEVFGS